MSDKELRMHQLRALEAMKLLDKELNKRGIEYCLIAGSALGAIRHKGFIPWDDDIDIAMTMKNYNVFLDIAPQIIQHPYKWQHTSIEGNFETLTGKISYGSSEPLITVFPLIKLSDNRFQRKQQWVIRKIMYPVWQRKVHFKVKQEYLDEGRNRKLAIVVSRIISCFISKNTVLRILRKNEIKYEELDVEWYCNIYSKYSLEKESIKSDWVKEIVRTPFEDTKFPIIKQYDNYLRNLYGEYMILPPEKERHPVHI